MGDTGSGISQIDKEIYKRDTLAKLETSGLEIEDVHVLNEVKSTFNRSIASLLSSDEKPTLDLITSVQNDEDHWIKERQNGINYAFGDNYGYQDYKHPARKFWLQFLGKNLELWKAVIVSRQEGYYGGDTNYLFDVNKLKQLYIFRSVFTRSPDLFVRLSKLIEYPFSKTEFMAVLEKIETTDLLERALTFILESYEKFAQVNQANAPCNWNPEVFVTETLFKCQKGLKKLNDKSFDEMLEEKRYIDSKTSRYEKGAWIYPKNHEIQLLHELKDYHGMDKVKMDDIHELVESLNYHEEKLLLIFIPLIKENPAGITGYIKFIKDLNINGDNYAQNIIKVFNYGFEHGVDIEFILELIKDKERVFFISQVLSSVSPEKGADRFLSFLSERSNDPILKIFLNTFLPDHEDLIHSDIDLFFQVIEFWERNKTKQNFNSINWGYVSRLKHLYKNNLEVLDNVIEPFITDEEAYCIFFLLLDAEFTQSIIDEVGRIQELIDIMKDIPNKSVKAVSEALIKLRTSSESNISWVKIIRDFLLKVNVKHPDISLTVCANWLKDLQDIHQSNLKKMEIVIEYMAYSDIQDPKTISKFIEIYLSQGEEEAKNYMNTLKGKAKGLVSSRISEEHRSSDEYQYLVRYVFPSGNYSNHEKNLNCGDRLEHIDRYQFDRDGYPVVLTGLLGYKVKEGAEPDQALLDAYTERLGGIRQFVSSRGPDNEALQKAFEEKVDAIFEEVAWPEFKSIAKLTLKEKMLCLFLGEAIRRRQKGQSGEPDFGICDLIVEYKYAFHEDLEAYVARSADSVKAYPDDMSRNYMLLAELSVIYGENVKHILRHNIFEELEGSDHYDDIVEVFSGKLGGDSTEKNLTAKQWTRIDNTFSNEKIPVEKKPDVLYKQVYDIFSSNIEFESKEQKLEFEEKLKVIFAELEADLTVEKFKELLPKFYKLRAVYRSSINAKLTELFTYDINQIFQELAKYEESVEEEAKERRMGGERDKESKKSAKKRNVRGFFTKTAETANARMGAYLCIAGDTKMWKNENYFELVLVDEDTNKCVGLVMLMEIKAENGKKYLWFGPNPFESFLDVVSSRACYEYLYERACEFAENNDFDGIVVPSKDEQILGQCTNRGGDFPGFIKASRLRDSKDNLVVVEFGEKHTLGGGYGYEDGALIWNKKKVA